MARHDDDSVAVGHDDVARDNQDTAANHRPVDGFNFVPSRPNATSRLLKVRGIRSVAISSVSRAVALLTTPVQPRLFHSRML